jgi:hypothetical protein
LRREDALFDFVDALFEGFQQVEKAIDNGISNRIKDEVCPSLHQVGSPMYTLPGRGDRWAVTVLNGNEAVGHQKAMDFGGFQRVLCPQECEQDHESIAIIGFEFWSLIAVTAILYGQGVKAKRFLEPQ